MWKKWIIEYALQAGSKDKQPNRVLILSDEHASYSGIYIPVFYSHLLSKPSL